MALVTALTAVPCRPVWAKAGTAASMSWSRRSRAERRTGAAAGPRAVARAASAGSAGSEGAGATG